MIREARALIFDFDGTLYDTKGFARRLVLARFWDGPLIAAERRIRKNMAGGDYGSPGAYYEAFFSRMSRMVKKPAEVLRFWYFDRYMPRFCDILKKYYRPRPGTAELFEALTGAAFPFAVYSDYPLTAERLAALGLDTGWGKLYGPEHFGAQKPAARPFVSIAGDMGVLPEHTMVIGDRDDTDGAGAAAAGMGYIGVGTRKKRETHAVFDWETLTGLLMDRLKLPA